MPTQVKVLNLAQLKTFKIVEGKNKRVVLNPVLKEYRKRLQKIANRHYQNLGTAVKQQLDRGIGDPDGGGARLVKSSDGEGKPVSYRTAAWPALTKNYRDRKPRSRRMWSKRGKLAGYVRGDLPRGRLKARISQRRSVPIPTRKDRVIAVHTVDFTVPGSAALATLMAEPFVFANADVANGVYAEGMNRRSSNLLAYPETARFKRGGREIRGRPWVAGFSGRMGREMHRAIRRL